MKGHIKRLAAPRTWPIVRKNKQRWVAKPSSSQKLDLCIPLSVAIRDSLKIADTAKEVKNILNNNDVLVNNRKVKDLRFGIGLFDVLSVKQLKANYRLVLTKKNKLAMVKISDAEANILPLKIKNKTLLKGKKLQINFTNGWNILSDKHPAISSTMLYDLKQGKLTEEIKVQEGSIVALIKGKHVGNLAKLKSLKSEGKLKKRHTVTLKSMDGKEEWRTTADCVFAVGNKKPEFTAIQ